MGRSWDYQFQYCSRKREFLNLLHHLTMQNMFLLNGLKMVWSGHPIQSLRVWVGWRCLVYIHFIIQQSDFNITFVYLLSFTPVSIACSAVGRSEVEITCEGIEPSVLLQCSFSGGPLHPCEI